jgi:hypothetical protein
MSQKPYTAIKNTQWGNFQTIITTNESICHLLEQNPPLQELCNDKSLMQFYRDTAARCVGIRLDHSEVGHERFETWEKKNLEEWIAELVDETDEAYEAATNQLVSNSQQEDAFDIAQPEGMTVELLAIIGSELGHHSCPASESWQYAGLLFQLRMICLWYLNGTEVTSNANPDFDDNDDQSPSGIQSLATPVDRKTVSATNWNVENRRDFHA